MKKIAFASFAGFAVIVSAFAAPVGLRHSQPVKPAMTAVIPSPTCPLSDPKGCGIYE